jgi:GTP cyclohydrolase I
MIDLQGSQDDRNIPIDEVGVCDIFHPIIVLDKDKGTQKTIACLSMTVNLPHHFKGTHMSRFFEVLNEYQEEMTIQTLSRLLPTLKERLQAERAKVEISFPYFLEKKAPVSKSPGLMKYECSFVGSAEDEGDDYILGVKIPVTSLCPCSKAISKYGAHNQRGHIGIEVRTVRKLNGSPELLWIEELIEIGESSASAPVYALLKREDEKALTEQAYENPVFVEDIVRNVAQKLMSDLRIAWFQVKTINVESIHNHNAFARVEWSRP